MIREVSDDNLDRSKLIKSIQDDESVALMLESFPIEERLEIWAEIDGSTQQPKLKTSKFFIV